ncbi:MAG: serine/threonine-protein kinase [Bryobacterales bacterium]|nr:serine/threonine-protein kinase [Bryobacterales bacterium]
MTGRTFAHYQIAEKLGEGGMGTVYKARDLHLDRFVGIKVLRADRHRDAERKRRFIVEAKAASALNHPNIITIHDIGTAEDVDYIVMEYVKGQTLAALIGHRGMALSDVLKYGIQIADALAAAHSAGIVHRDLKPANVMIAADGRVKVLDFGLAKLTEAVAPDPDQPTRTIRAAETEQGQILGTTAYMAPEQIEGKKVDARTDIFAFGLVLYEMVTGKRAFERDSRMGTLTAILKEQHTPPGELATGVPTELDKIINRCLRKDPNRRYQTMRDVGNALEELKEDSESGRVAVPLVNDSGRKPRKPLLFVTGAVVGALVITFGGITLLKRSPSPTATPQIRSRPLTSDSSLNVAPAISRDGRLVAYASNRGGNSNLDIWLQPLTESTPPIRLTRNEADDDQPDFSPDGGLIVFHSNRNGGGLYVVPAYGGEERLLVRGGLFPRFSPDGKTVAYATDFNPQSESVINIIPVTGGQPVRLAADVHWATAPAFAPDGSRVLFTGAPALASGDYDLWTTAVNGGPSLRTGIIGTIQPRPFQASGGDWVGDRVYIASRDRIIAVPVSGDGRAAGSAQEIAYAAGARSARLASLGDNLRLVFSTGSSASHLWRQRIDWNEARLAGELEPLPHSGGTQDMIGGAMLHRRFVYSQIEPQGSSFRLRDLDAGTDVTVASGGGRARLSADGSQITYVSGPNRELFLIPAVGGDARKLAADKSIANIWNWFPDGSRIVYYGGSPIRFFTYHLATATNDVLLAHPTLSIHGAEVSPDMKWIAFHTPTGNESRIFITPLRERQGAPEAAWIRIADKGNNRRPWWSPDGRILYFRSERDGFACFWAQRLDPQTKRPAGEPFAVKHLHSKRLTFAFGPAILPDQFVIAVLDNTANITLAEFKN